MTNRQGANQSNAAITHIERSFLTKDNYTGIISNRNKCESCIKQTGLFMKKNLFLLLALLSILTCFFNWNILKSPIGTYFQLADHSPSQHVSASVHAAQRKLKKCLFISENERFKAEQIGYGTCNRAQTRLEKQENAWDIYKKSYCPSGGAAPIINPYHMTKKASWYAYNGQEQSNHWPIGLATRPAN